VSGPRDREPLLCFVHIERAGGTTLHHLLRSNSLSAVTLTPWYYWPNEAHAVFEAAEARAFFRLVPGVRVFGGHTTRTWLGYEQALGRPLRYLTFLREPRARYLSHYRYQKHVMGVPWTLETFLAEPRFRDFMTSRIAGVADVEAAKRRLAEDFAFVGLTERFDESLVLMARALELEGFDLRYERRNAVESGDCAEGLAGHAGAIAESNRLDLELYRFAAEELFPAQVHRLGGDPAAAANALAAACQGYRFPRWRLLAAGLFRHGYYRHVERLARLARTSPRGPAAPAPAPGPVRR